MATNSYDQLLADLGATFRPQREWVEGRGLYLITGHFLSGIGAGAWFFSLLFHYRPGLLLAFLAAGLGGVAHLLFLGRPERFWRMLKIRRSWISRGFVGISLFLPFSFLYLLPLFIPGIPWSSEEALSRAFLLLSVLGMLIIFVYKGNVYAASRGIPFWNSPLLPVLYIVYALRGGVALILLSLPFTGNSLNSEGAAIIELWIAVSAAVMILFYLGVMANTNVAARRSVTDLARGRVSGSFYLGTVGIGLVVPILLGAIGYLSPLSQLILAAIGFFSLVGDFFAKYTIAKAGIYMPLLPVERG